MAFVPVNPATGFQGPRYIEPNEEFLVPGIPGTTYAAGDLIYRLGSGAVANAGLFQKVGAETHLAVGVVTRTTVCPANTVPFPGGGPGSSDWLSGPQTGPAGALIPMRLFASYGSAVWEAPITGYFDDTVAAYSSVSLTLTASPGADDDANGGLLYVYEGPGAGQWNHIIDYAHGTKIVTLARVFAVAPTTASKVIFFENASNGGGTGIFGLTEAKDSNEIQVDGGVADGPLIIPMCGSKVAEFMRRGTLPVTKTSNLRTAITI
jgi:hypothetical protein